MARSPLDDATADRIFAGALDPEDAPPGYGGVVALIAALHQAGAKGPIPGRAEAVSSIAAAIRSAPVTSAAGTGRRRGMSKWLSFKALAIALPALALTGGTAAAATGSLPGPAQSAVAHALSHVGISVPSGEPVGPNATGPARHGLCTAYQAGIEHGHAKNHGVAFRNLTKAATSAGETVTQFCTGVTPGNGQSDDSRNKGVPEGSDTNSGPQGSSTDQGSQGSNTDQGSQGPNSQGSQGSNTNSGPQGSNTQGSQGSNTQGSQGSNTQGSQQGSGR